MPGPSSRHTYDRHYTELNIGVSKNEQMARIKKACCPLEGSDQAEKTEADWAQQVYLILQK